MKPLKKVLTGIAFFFLALPFAKAQNVYLQQILKIKPACIFSFNPDKKNPDILILEMDFGSAEFKNQAEAESLKGKTILKVELYYTAYQLSDSFSQPKLNRERFENLEKTVGGIFSQTAIEYKIFAQTSCRTESEAKKYFHGFVITCRPAPSAEFVRDEMGKMNKVLGSDSLGKDTFDLVTDIRTVRKWIPTGFYLPASSHKKDKGIVYSTPGIFNRKPERKLRIDTVKTISHIKRFCPSSTALNYFFSNQPDSTIFTVMKRNKKWNEILFVCDVTSSMSPYTMQLLLWHKLNYSTGKAKYFTFFNDGDTKHEEFKKIGSIGGIYHTASNSYEEMQAKMEEAMKNGFGGLDMPENNCEALIKAIQLHPDAQEIVMVADNYASIKDIELLGQITKPVHIIMCGATWGINTDYLELARKTKGSVHTMEEDIVNLTEMKEGSTVKIGKTSYLISKGQFFPVLEN